jgi:hypothetical protein
MFKDTFAKIIGKERKKRIKLRELVYPSSLLLHHNLHPVVLLDACIPFEIVQRPWCQALFQS